MLKELTINNFAIIDNLEIIFKDGLTVLTGETGAGKSIIADALDFLLGSRASSDLIKSGFNKALVEGTFTLPNKIKSYLEKNDFELSDNNLITISRELTENGSKARINGSLANVSHLLFLREHLIDIHQQSEHIELLRIEKQLEILDSFGNSSHQKIIEDYKKTFFEYQSLKNKLNYYLENSASLAKKLDFLNFQVEEIKAAKIKDINEENELTTKREILLNKKELVENASIIYELINSEGEHNLLSTLAQIKKLIIRSSEHDKSFEPYLENIENLAYHLKDISSFANSYKESLNEKNNELHEIEERLDLFYRLKKKYGKTLAEVLEYFEKIKIELNTEMEAGQDLPLLEGSFKEKEREINILGEKLSQSREKITKQFVDKVNEELTTLGFKEVLLVVEFTSCELSINGKEQIQFLFSANPDEPPKPLLKVASGGELSRIMLAIKSITGIGFPWQARAMIFDEIDIGVSGEIAASVAKKLYKISRSNQVIAITHQPIICAMADNHFVIEKKITNETTQVFIREVTSSEKPEALATLLTPEKKLKEGITEDAKVFAKSLLENAKKAKEKELV